MQQLQLLTRRWLLVSEVHDLREMRWRGRTWISRTGSGVTGWVKIAFGSTREVQIRATVMFLQEGGNGVAGSRGRDKAASEVLVEAGDGAKIWWT